MKRQEMESYIRRLREDDPTLTELNLNFVRLTYKNIEDIAKALEKNTSLIRLDLFRCRIGDLGAKLIAKALRTNRTLTALHLDFNYFGDNGANSMDRALSDPELENVGGNDVSDEGTNALEASMASNTVLTSLILFGNGDRFVCNNPLLSRWLRENRDKEQDIYAIEKRALMPLILAGTDRIPLFYYRFRARIDLIVPGLLSRTRRERSGPKRKDDAGERQDYGRLQVRWDEATDKFQAEVATVRASVSWRRKQSDRKRKHDAGGSMSMKDEQDYGRLQTHWDEATATFQAEVAAARANLSTAKHIKANII